MKGPLVLAANHPNSFLDAILLASLFRHPVYSLARGDAFVSGFVRRILASLYMMPVYRISEGKKNIKHNYHTFDKVHELLKLDKIVLIFSEGRCVNEWHLRPLMKGTARISMLAWEEGIPLKVLPVGINYSSFRHFGKSVKINFGNIITADEFSGRNGKDILAFNDRLQKELSQLVFEIPQNDVASRRRIFEKRNDPWIKSLLLIPAAIGYLLNAPFYYAAHAIIRNRANGHYDSIMVGIMFLFYPLYVVLFASIVVAITQSWYALLLIPGMFLLSLAVVQARSVVE